MANWIPKIIYSTTTITLSIPAVGDPLNESVMVETEVSTSSSGIKQTATHFIEETIEVELGFLTKTLLDSLRTFYETWGGLGKTFAYYPSSDEASRGNYTLVEGSKFEPRRIAPDGSGDFLYDLTLEMRKTK